MSEKKYKSGSVIDAEIAKLLEKKKGMIDGKVEIFNKAFLNKDTKDKLVNLSDTEIRELAKMIQNNFDKLLEFGRNSLNAKKQKKESAQNENQSSVY